MQLEDPISRVEALNLALRMEESARDLYRRIASSLRGAEQYHRHVVLFEALSQDEEIHANMYRNMLTRGESKQEKASVNIPEELLSAIRSVAEMPIPEALDPDEALGLSLHLESVTLRFYYMLLGFLEAERERRNVANIIKVEKRHLTEVAGILADEADKKARYDFRA